MLAEDKGSKGWMREISHAILPVHQKQYVLGPLPLRVRPDWMVAELAPGLILSHCPKLDATSLRTRDGVSYILLGQAVPADARLHSMQEGFARRDAAEIENWSGFWSGRWLLVAPDRLIPDASCSLSVNYRRLGARVWISSSVALLGDHLADAAPAPRIPWHIKHVKGMDWVPVPLTTREGIFKLLPQRTIDPLSGAIQPVRFNAPSVSTSNNAAVFALALQTLLANWAQCGSTDRWLGLTGGLDTRTVLAAALAAGVQARSYTILYPFMKNPDRVLPPRIAARVRIPHLFVRMPTLVPEEVERRHAMIAEHMDGATAHPSFDHLAQHDHGAADGPESNSVNGTCFGLGRCYFWPRFSNIGLGEARPTADDVLAAFTFQSSWRHEPLGAWRHALQAWLDSLSEPVPLALDWRDRFHLDQRLGGWNANIRRYNDLLNGTSFSPANSLWMFSLLLQPTPALRQAGALQKDAIRLMAPHLLDLPINPKPVSVRLKGEAKRLLGPRLVRALKPLGWATGLLKR